MKAHLVLPLDRLHSNGLKKKKEVLYDVQSISMYSMYHAVPSVVPGLRINFFESKRGREGSHAAEQLVIQLIDLIRWKRLRGYFISSTSTPLIPTVHKVI